MTVINVENIGKSYVIKHQNQARQDTLRDTLNVLIKRAVKRVLHPKKAQYELGKKEVFWALKDIFFNVKQGDRLGIIGKNGAGKSTLLKILSRITEPTTGKATLKGRVSSLLEVGTGFHPELTGRENIFLNGAILGMTRKEIISKFDEIVAFSEIEKFLDTPVKRYSSGMYVRLAFAVAAHLEPEILIVDEVLAVGDMQFQKKCLGKMQDVASEGRTVLFVSHNMGAIKNLCTRGILLNQGHLEYEGEIHSVIEKYQKLGIETSCRGYCDIEPIDNSKFNFNRIAVYKNNQLYDHVPCDVFDKISIEIDYTVFEELRNHTLYLQIKKEGEVVFGSFDTSSDPDLAESRKKGKYKTKFHIPTPLLKPGLYSVTIYCGVLRSAPIQTCQDIISFEVELWSKDVHHAYTKERPGVVVVDSKWETKYQQEL